MDEASQQALGETQKTMTNRVEREKIKKDNAALQQVDADVEALVGNGTNKDAMYEAAAKILGDMAKDTDGDPDKMREVMQNAQRDPKAFLNSLSEDNKKMIRGIAEDIEKIDSQKP